MVSKLVNTAKVTLQLCLMRKGSGESVGLTMWQAMGCVMRQATLGSVNETKFELKRIG